MTSFHIGISLCILALITGMTNGGTHINLLGTSAHLICYLLLSYNVFCLHKQLGKSSANGYHIGPIEVAVFMLVPFFYIFWNTYWMESCCRNIADRIPFDKKRFFGLHMYSWLVLALSPLCYPDNMDRLPSSVSLLSLICFFSLLQNLSRKVQVELIESPGLQKSF